MFPYLKVWCLMSRGFDVLFPNGLKVGKWFEVKWPNDGLRLEDSLRGYEYFEL